MDELQNELQELINLAPENMDDVQKSRLSELPMLIVQAATSALEKKSKDFDSAVAQKEHWREKAEKGEVNQKTLEARLTQGQKDAIAVGEYINISTALEGLDSREKEYLASQHTMTGKPLSEIRESEDFQFWRSSYQQKVEKDKLNLKPSSRQSESDEPQSLEEALAQASTIAEKEEILAKMGYDFKTKSRSDRVVLGSRNY